MDFGTTARLHQTLSSTSRSRARVLPPRSNSTRTTSHQMTSRTARPGVRFVRHDPDAVLRASQRAQEQTNPVPPPAEAAAARSSTSSASEAMRSRHEQRRQREEGQKSKDALLGRERTELLLEENMQRQRMEELKIAQFEAASVSDSSIPLRLKKSPPSSSASQRITKAAATSVSPSSSPPESPRSTATTFDPVPQSTEDARKLAVHLGFQNNDTIHATVPMMEISPGVTARLRGVTEIRDYVRRDEIVPVLCFACELAMFTIADASYVLCPSCRVVNPNQEVEENEFRGVASDEGGVGLGFTFQDLQNIQMEILQDDN